MFYLRVILRRGMDIIPEEVQQMTFLDFIEEKIHNLLQWCIEYREENKENLTEEQMELLQTSIDGYQRLCDSDIIVKQQILKLLMEQILLPHWTAVEEEDGSHHFAFNVDSYREKEAKLRALAVYMAKSQGTITEEEAEKVMNADLPEDVQEKLYLYFTCFCDVYTTCTNL